jgi:ribosomal protein S18 acetylase RimI-like enzyme
MGLRDDATIAIRPCRLEECAAVLALWERAGAIPSPTDTLEELQRLVRTHGDGFLVAIQRNTVVGSVIAGWDGWRGNIYRLAVAPEARRHGLARRLVQEAERALHAKGARRFSALVARHEPHALAFWDALADIGWRRDARMLRYIKNAD